MPAFSILFGEGRGVGLRPGRSLTEREPPYFRDLNLDAFVEGATAGMDEYDLKSFFYGPLDDEAAIVYRQNVVHDLVGRPALDMVKEFAIGMRRARELEAQVSRLQDERQKDSWFLDEVETYCATVVELGRALGKAELRSRGMTACRDYLRDYVGSWRFAALRGEAGALREALASVRYCLFIRHDAVRVKKYEGEAEYSVEIERIFERFAQGAGKEYLTQFTDSRDLNDVEADILDMVAILYPGEFEELGGFRSRNASYADPCIVAFDREIQFYVSYLDYIAPIRRAGSAFCYPKVSRVSKELQSRGGFDIVLARKLAQEGAAPVPNDFRLEGAERILVVTGPNQGGKTTFARAFGQLHYLARLGLPVPGSEARLLLCDKILTHFDREERVEAQRGRLLEDLVRMRGILDEATGESVILLNEIFTSTALNDAIYLGEQVIRRIMELDAPCVCVTFIDELAKLGEKTVSMMSMVDPDRPAVRTYKILRKPPDGLAYALSIAEKYGLTRDRIVERVKE